MVTSGLRSCQIWGSAAADKISECKNYRSVGHRDRDLDSTSRFRRFSRDRDRVFQPILDGGSRIEIATFNLFGSPQAGMLKPSSIRHKRRIVRVRVRHLCDTSTALGSVFSSTFERTQHLPYTVFKCVTSFLMIVIHVILRSTTTSRLFSLPMCSHCHTTS